MLQLELPLYTADIYFDIVADGNYDSMAVIQKLHSGLAQAQKRSGVDNAIATFLLEVLDEIECSETTSNGQYPATLISLNSNSDHNLMTTLCNVDMSDDNAVMNIYPVGEKMDGCWDVTRTTITQFLHSLFAKCDFEILEFEPDISILPISSAQVKDCVGNVLSQAVVQRK